MTTQQNTHPAPRQPSALSPRELELLAALEDAKNLLDSLASELEYGRDRNQSWANDMHSKAFDGYRKAKAAIAKVVSS